MVLKINTNELKSLAIEESINNITVLVQKSNGATQKDLQVIKNALVELMD